MSKIICIMNQKGGVGKTTTTLNLGIGLKNLGKKVLLIDLDPQASLTTSMGIQHRELTVTIFHLFLKETELSEVIIQRHGLDLLPSSLALSGFDAELSHIAGREQLLKEILQEIREQYDCILIDCPPNLGLLTLNALTASEGILIPIYAEYLPLDGMSYLLETIEIIQERLNPDLKLEGVIVTKFDSRQKLQREVVSTIRKHFGPKLLSTMIRSNVALAEAPSFGQDIYTYKPESAGARDYKNLCREIINEGII